jgi:uncharacterized CHY-type Zn-finger protein
MMLKLSKRIPARTKTIEFEWCKQEYMKMSPGFKEIRAKSRNPMDKCWWCGHEFEDGEMMALAHPEGKKNVVLCQTCVAEMQGENE